MGIMDGYFTTGKYLGLRHEELMEAYDLLNF